MFQSPYVSLYDNNYREYILSTVLKMYRKFATSNYVDIFAEICFCCCGKPINWRAIRAISHER